MGPGENTLPADVVGFIDDRIESVPHLEAVLLLWENSHLRWDVDLMAARLYVSKERAAAILEDLVARELVVCYRNGEKPYYRYDNDWDAEHGELMARVADTYRHQLLRVTGLIHSKAPTAVRDFARAFHIPMKK